MTDALVEITIRWPDLEIIGVKGEVRRTYEKACLDSFEALQKAVGICIGPGVLKIIKGLIGEATDCKQVAFMVKECCHSMILSLTKDVLVSSPRPKELEEAKKFYSKMVKANPRLYNRCAAFAPGSALVEGIDPKVK